MDLRNASRGGGRRISRRWTISTAVAATGAGVLATTLISGATAAESSSTDRIFPGHKPTVVLVHGAFTDASSWHGVIGNLRHSGYQVVAPANPLRDLTADSAYIADVVRGIKGPVILVGHSYGGAVITNAAGIAANVKGLVYVAGFAPDKGESASGIDARYPETAIKSSITPLPHPDGTVDLSIAPEKFPRVFATYVPHHKAVQMAAAQRPIAAAAVQTASGQPAWKSLPSWFLIPTQDNALHPDAQADMAERAHAKQIVQVKAGHAVSVSRPDVVANLIRTAAWRTRDR